MEEQEPIDAVFLKRLEQAYIRERTNLGETKADHLPVEASRPVLGCAVVLLGPVIVLCLIVVLAHLPTTLPLWTTILPPAAVIVTGLILVRVYHQRAKRNEIGALRKQITELETALTEVRAELARLPSTQPDRSTRVQLVFLPSNPDCDHWQELHQTHVRVIRVLELDEAKMGNEFHYSKRIELDERRKRSDELKQQISANCQ